MNCSEFEKRVRLMLCVWGETFRIDREIDPLGHQSENMLQGLVTFGGPPPRVTGYKPESIDSDAQLVEAAICDLWRDGRQVAWTMRAFWCSGGRRGVERYQLAQYLCRDHFSKREYYLRIELGLQHVMAYIARSVRIAA